MRGIRKLVLVTLGLAMAAVVSLPGLVMAAGADSTCYTGCETTVQTQPPHAPDAPAAASTPVAVSTDSGLAFTGTDVIEIVASGLAALLGGTLLVRVSRSRRSAVVS